MVYVIAIIVLILLVLFVPPIILIIGGVFLLIMPGFEVVEVAAIVIGVIKLALSGK